MDSTAAISPRLHAEQAEPKQSSALEERLLQYKTEIQSLQSKVEEILKQPSIATVSAEVQRLQTKLDEISKPSEAVLPTLEVSVKSLTRQVSCIDERIKLLETNQQVGLQQPGDVEAAGEFTQIRDMEVRLAKVEQSSSLSDDGVLAKWLQQQLALVGAKSATDTELKQLVEPAIDNTDNAREENAGQCTIERPLQESVWEASLLMWLPQIGPGSSAFLLLTLGLNLFAQGYMCFVLLTSAEFNGSDSLSDEVGVMNDWRNVDGHSVTYTNSFDVNLVSRVCDLDSSLSLAATQSSLLSDINDYLGLDAEDLEFSGIPVGPLLCMLCVTVFATMIVREWRDVAVFLECLIRLPHHSTQIEDGALKAISHIRLAFMLALSSFRCCISSFLLYNGITWLTSTSSIGDLILNAAALGFVIDIDELFFATFLPMSVPCFLQHLEPLTCLPARFKVDAAVPLVFVGGIGVIAYFAKVARFANDMIDVKVALCGGSKDFILKDNANLGFTVARLPAGGKGIQASKESDKATRSSTELRQNPKMISPDHYFIEKVRASVYSEGVLPTMSIWCKTDPFCVDIMTGDAPRIGGFINQQCEDLDTDTFPGFEQLFRAAYEFWKGGGAYNAPEGYTCPAYEPDYKASGGSCAPPEPLLPFRCRSYKHLCDESVSNILIRMICPVTCGCVDPMSGLYLAGAQSGCPLSCGLARSNAEASLPCIDVDVSDGAPRQNWTRYWTGLQFWEGVSGNLPEGDLADRFFEGGCEFLNQEFSTLNAWPFWKPCEVTDNMATIGSTSLVAFCPRTCCNNNATCLSSCKGAG